MKAGVLEAELDICYEGFTNMLRRHIILTIVLAPQRLINLAHERVFEGNEVALGTWPFFFVSRDEPSPSFLRYFKLNSVVFRTVQFHVELCRVDLAIVLE